MKMKYLGTAAAEGIPALFCNCDICKTARKKKGRNIRTRSQAIIDGELLIDFPPDTYLHTLNENIDLIKIEHCILTHSHPDHLYAEDFKMRRKGFAHFNGDKESCLNVYGSEKTGEPLLKSLSEANLSKDKRVIYNILKPFETKNIGKYKVTPMKAQHSQKTEPFIYMVSDGKKRLLYAHDTGYFPEETWDFLKREKPYFDLVSFDCTEYSISSLTNGHMGMPVIKKAADRLLEYSCIDDKTFLILNHFSHNSGLNYDELVALAKKEGFLVSFDGMELEF